MMELFEFLGARYGWCWYDEYYWSILYWPAPRRYVVRPVLLNRPLTILSGFKSRNRGRHWDRKR